MAACTALAESLTISTGLFTRVVGWYHSHPHITVLPSHVDVSTQVRHTGRSEAGQGGGGRAGKQAARQQPDRQVQSWSDRVAYRRCDMSSSGIRTLNKAASNCGRTPDPCSSIPWHFRFNPHILRMTMCFKYARAHTAGDVPAL